jgi:hypothetical protein
MMRARTRQRTQEEHAAHLKRVYVLGMIVTILMTVFCLWCIHLFNQINVHPDALGLSAISVGIVGILVFFIFLYRLQIDCALSRHRRWIALIIHAFLVVLFFVLVIVLGFVSEFGRPDLWGNYNVETASRSWIICILVVGAITLLGSFLELIGYAFSATERKARDENDRNQAGNEP